MTQNRSFYVPLLTMFASILASSACGPDDRAVDDVKANEEEIVAKAYRAPHLFCVRETDTPADGAISYVKVKPVRGGKSDFEIGQWQLFSGFDRPLVAVMGAEVTSVTKARQLSIENAESRLLVSNADGSGLSGTFTFEGKKTILSCSPHAMYCATAKTSKHEFPIDRLVLRHAGEVVNLQEVIIGVTADLTVHTAPASAPTFLAPFTMAIDTDSKGVLDARSAHAEDPLTGAVDVKWDGAKKKLVATFAPSAAFAKSLVVPDAGFATADCDFAEPETAGATTDAR